MWSELVGVLLLAAQLSSHPITTADRCTTLHCPPPGVPPGNMFEAPDDKETYKSVAPGSLTPDAPKSNGALDEGSDSGAKEAK